MKIIKLRLFAILLFALSSAAFLVGENILFFKTISINSNISRGLQNQDLAQFSLSFQSTNLSEITFTSLTYKLNWTTIQAVMPIGKLELFKNNKSIAMGLFDADNKVKLTLSTPEILTSNNTNSYLLKGDFYSLTGDGNPQTFNLSISNSFIKLYPNYTVNFSNLDATDSSFPNTNGNFTLYERKVAISNCSSLVSPVTFYERDDDTTVGAFSFQAANFPFTSQQISISKFKLIYNGSDINDLQNYSVFLDDGDKIFNNTVDTLLSTTQNLAASTDIYLDYPIILEDFTPILIWIVTKIDPQATIGNEVKLLLDNDANNYYPTGLYITNISTILTSLTNLIDDSLAPQGISGASIKSGDERILLQWTNPTNLDTYGIRIAYEIGAAAISPTNGGDFLDIIITNKIGGSMESLVTNLVNGSNYYFTIYSFDNATNWSVVSSTLNATPAVITNYPAIPEGITISPFADRYQINWINSTEPEHYCYRLRTYTENNSSINISDIIMTNNVVILKQDIGLSASEAYPVVYFSVVNYNINETASSNDFIDSIGAQARGIKISSTPIPLNSGKVYNSVFQPAFNEYARILVSLQKESTVEIRIFSIAGRHIKTIIKNRLGAGEHEFRWHGNDSGNSTVTPGLYFVHILFENQSITKKVFLRR